MSSLNNKQLVTFAIGAAVGIAVYVIVAKKRAG